MFARADRHFSPGLGFGPALAALLPFVQQAVGAGLSSGGARDAKLAEKAAVKADYRAFRSSMMGALPDVGYTAALSFFRSTGIVPLFDNAPGGVVKTTWASIEKPAPAAGKRFTYNDDFPGPLVAGRERAVSELAQKDFIRPLAPVEVRHSRWSDGSWFTTIQTPVEGIPAVIRDIQAGIDPLAPAEAGLLPGFPSLPAGAALPVAIIGIAALLFLPKLLRR